MIYSVVIHMGWYMICLLWDVLVRCVLLLMMELSAMVWSSIIKFHSKVNINVKRSQYTICCEYSMLHHKSTVYACTLTYTDSDHVILQNVASAKTKISNYVYTVGPRYMFGHNKFVFIPCKILFNIIHFVIINTALSELNQFTNCI